ncbi:MAG: hypothetical protein JWN65_1107, partial [Solirubrobacterales bacterium]|nr:hypothetical protein [Solirubrobacterales bacterium]
MTDGAGRPDPPTPRPGSLEWLADQHGDAPAIVDAADGRILTRAEHDAHATALAHGLTAEHGVTSQTRVAVTLASGPDLLVVLYALAKLGAAPVLLPPAAPTGDALALARTAGCALLIAGILLELVGITLERREEDRKARRTPV